MIFTYLQRHTADIGTKGTIGTRSTKRPCFAESNLFTISGLVPWVPTVPFPAVCMSIFDGVFGESETIAEPNGPDQPLSASGGGEESLSPNEEEERIDDDESDFWIIAPETSALLDELEEVDFDDVPVCSCGRYCDVQTLDDAWHCSECDPSAEERRKRTQRLLANAKRIRRENGLSESNVTQANPQP